MGVIVTEPPLAAVTGLPTYIVDQVIRRDLGSGTASILNCKTVNGVYVPQCQIIIAARDLLPIGLAASDFAAEMYRRYQVEWLEQIGVRHAAPAFTSKKSGR